MPRISIITRTRDRAVLLSRAIATLKHQTVRDFEWILVNDGGDGPQLDRLIAGLPREIQSHLVRIDNEVSSGMEAAATQGFVAATGEYIAVLDDDDTWEPEFLEKCVGYLDANPETVAVATCVDVVYERVDDGQVIEERRELFAQARDDVALVELVVENTVPPVSLVSRASVAREIGFWDPSLPVLADWDYLLRLAIAGPISYLREEGTLAHWHHRPASSDSLGNSIFVLGSLHDRYHDIIRDRYLRRDLQSHGGLGFALALGHYVRGGRTAKTHLETGIHQAQHVQFVQLSREVDELRKLVADQSEQVDHLVAAQRRNEAQLDRVVAAADLFHRLVPHLLKRWLKA